MDAELLERGRERLEALRKALPSRRPVVIVPHDYPDPDAFASAAALHLLLKEAFYVSSQIVFTGEVSRAENREMLRHSRYAWHLLSQWRARKRKTPCILVDAHPSSANVTLPESFEVVGVIDHHPPPRRTELSVPFQDIRREAGATATIVYEYLAAAGISIPTWLASLMVYAIATETLDLSRNWTPEDRQAYGALIARANMGILGQIRYAALPRSYYVQLQEALKNTFVYGRVAWAHVDNVAQPEIVPEIADLLCRMERVTWSFCTGCCGGRLIVSVRSSLPSAHCGRVLRKALAALNGEGGGHDWMAAGVISLGTLDKTGQTALREQLVQYLLQAIERRPVQREALMDLERMLVPPNEARDGPRPARCT
jgi:nanoRNase/pAp phosphatase (c-di-AMP/oligoRNAs hydrolase)